MGQTIADLSPGDVACVSNIDASTSAMQRLLEMGLTPGTEIEFIGTALLGDPIEIRLRGYRLSLRKSEAALIQIEPASHSEE